MNHALKEGLPVTVITMVHKLNLTELPALRRLLLGRNIAWQIQFAWAEGKRFSLELRNHFYRFIMKARRRPDTTSTRRRT